MTAGASTPACSESTESTDVTLDIDLEAASLTPVTAYLRGDQDPLPPIPAGMLDPDPLSPEERIECKRLIPGAEPTGDQPGQRVQAVAHSLQSDASRWRNVWVRPGHSYETPAADVQSDGLDDEWTGDAETRDVPNFRGAVKSILREALLTGRERRAGDTPIGGSIRGYALAMDQPTPFVYEYLRYLKWVEEHAPR